MSFAEKNNKQGVVGIEINGNSLHIERINYDSAVELLSIPHEPKRLNEALLELQNLPAGDITPESPYLEIKILITEPEPSLRNRIEKALKGKSVRLARISAVTPDNTGENNLITPEELLQISPIEIAERAFEQQYGGSKMPDSLKNLLQEVIREVER
jgi:exonuclease SbcD